MTTAQTTTGTAIAAAVASRPRSASGGEGHPVVGGVEIWVTLARNLCEHHMPWDVGGTWEKSLLQSGQLSGRSGALIPYT